MLHIAYIAYCILHIHNCYYITGQFSMEVPSGIFEEVIVYSTQYDRRNELILFGSIQGWFNDR